MKNSELELYTDYLLSSFGATTATGLSAMVGGDVSHDRITRFLSGQDYTSRHLWLQVKTMVREVENAQGVLIFDDTIQEKAWELMRATSLITLSSSGALPALHTAGTQANLTASRPQARPVRAGLVNQE